VIISVVAIALGSVANTFSPRAIPWVTEWDNKIETTAREDGIQVVDLEGMRKVVEAGTHVLLDARPQVDYEVAHIPGSLSLPSTELNTTFPQVQLLLTAEQPIMVYCSGRSCTESLRLAHFLIEQGYSNVYLFPGGLQQWREAGLPLEVGH